MNFDEYRKVRTQEIRELIAERECQPILFLGAGLSRRYINAPSWHDALRAAADKMGPEGPTYDYYHQLFSGDAIKIGSQLAKDLHQWAWGKGKNTFPAALYKEPHADSFLKYLVAAQLNKALPTAEKLHAGAYKSEIKLLSRVRAHAIITTNFDQLGETIFPGYEPIIGQKVLSYNTHSFGEIFKIHGCVTNPSSMILTETDYDEFTENKTYLSAKLLAYFAEHPVFVFGYGFNDPNVAAILAGVGKIIAKEAGLIPNLVYVKWQADADKQTNLAHEGLVVSGGKNYRVRTIVTNTFEWIFNELAQDQELKSVNTKLLRALAARAYKLIRTDIPKGLLEVDYKLLEGIANEDDELPKLLGITQANNPNMSHPFTLTQVALQLGYSGWNDASKLLDRVEKKTGTNLRKSDNKYHWRIMIGAKSEARKWSPAAVELLKLVRDGKPYKLQV